MATNAANPLLDDMPPPVPKKKPRQTSEEKIAALELKQNQLAERIKDEKAKIAKQSRKDDTRRKIVAGALALEHMTLDENFRYQMQDLIRNHVKEKDRHLFDL